MKITLFIIALISALIKSHDIPQVNDWIQDNNVDSETWLPKNKVIEFVMLIIKHNKDFEFIPIQYHLQLAKLLTSEIKDGIKFHLCADILKDQKNQEKAANFFKKLQKEGKIVIPEELKKKQTERIEKARKKEEEKKRIREENKQKRAAKKAERAKKEAEKASNVMDAKDEL